MYGPGIGNERNQQTLGVFLLTQKPDPLNSSGLIHQIYLVRVKPVGLAEFTAFLWHPLNPMVVVSGIVMIIMKKYNRIVTVKITITIITLHPLTSRLRTTHTYTHKTHIHLNSLQSHHTPSKANLKSYI